MSKTKITVTGRTISSPTYVQMAGRLRGVSLPIEPTGYAELDARVAAEEVTINAFGYPTRVVADAFKKLADLTRGVAGMHGLLLLLYGKCKACEELKSEGVPDVD